MTRPRASPAWPASRFTLFLTAVCIVLGVWQLQRRLAKHELIAALTSVSRRHRSLCRRRHDGPR